MRKLAHTARLVPHEAGRPGGPAPGRERLRRSTARAAFFLSSTQTSMKNIDHQRLDQVVRDARKAADTRAEGYREKALKLYPWICGRCARTFTQTNLRELTVHHRDHNHDNNPSDGSNWELLCLYCHDNEHQKQIEADRGYTDSSSGHKVATHNPFAALQGLLKK